MTKGGGKLFPPTEIPEGNHGSPAAAAGAGSYDANPCQESDRQKSGFSLARAVLAQCECVYVHSRWRVGRGERGGVARSAWRAQERIFAVRSILP